MLFLSLLSGCGKPATVPRGADEEGREVIHPLMSIQNEKLKMRPYAKCNGKCHVGALLVHIFAHAIQANRQ